MDVRISILTAVLSLLLFIVCLWRKPKYAYYVGLVSIVLYIHTSTNAIETIFGIGWGYILVGHVTIVVLLYLLYHCIR